MHGIGLLVTMVTAMICWADAVCAQGLWEYVSPRPQAELVSAGTTIAVRQGEAIDKSSLADSLFTVEGSQSGLRSGQVILADDAKTVIFQPADPFAPSETVTVTVHSGIRTTSGEILSSLAYTFTVSPKSFPNSSFRMDESDAYDLRDGNLSQAGDTDAPRHTNVTYATLPDSFPFVSVTVPANNTGEGYLFLSNFSGRPPHPYLLIMDNKGEPVFFRKVTEGVRHNDFKKQANGSLTYYDRAARIYRAMDSSYRFVDIYQAGNGYAIDGHGIQIAENNHILLQVYDHQPVDMSQIVAGGAPSAMVEGAIVQELDPSRNVIFEWRSWDHFAITDASDDIDLTAEEVRASHINAVEWDDDGNILISIRNMDEITKIDRRTADIIWRLGGKKNEFTFTNDERPFSHQHDVRRLPNGNITLFDNGNASDPPYSRVVEYQLDEINKTATKVWEYRNQPEDIISTATGSAQRLSNGNTVIGWGNVVDWGSQGVDEPFPVVTEVMPDGAKAFEMHFLSNESSYRVFRQAWEGRPIEPPTLRVNIQPSTASLHYSWNGATQIASYRVYGGNTTAPGDLIDVQPKASYETTTVLVDNPSDPCYFYRVMPIDDEGNETIYSNVVFMGDTSCALVAEVTPTGAVTKTFTTTQAGPARSTTLHVPSGAVSDTITLIYTDQAPATQVPPGGLVATEMAFTVNAFQDGNPQTGFAFNVPASVRLDYLDSAVAGLDEMSLAAYGWDSDQQAWSAEGLVVTEHDMVNNRLTFETAHLTQFAVFATKSAVPITQLNLVQDGSFEAGPSGSAWQQGSSNLPFVICDSECSYPYIPQSHTGTYWVFFGGGLPQKEEAYIRQEITIPSGEVMTATLTFWLRIAESSNTGQDVFAVSVDKNNLFSVRDTDRPGYQSYTPVSLDVTDYVSGTHVLSFDAIVQERSLTAFYLDDVSLVVAGSFEPNPSIYLPTILGGGGMKSMGPRKEP